MNVVEHNSQLLVSDNGLASTVHDPDILFMQSGSQPVELCSFSHVLQGYLSTFSDSYSYCLTWICQISEGKCLS